MSQGVYVLGGKCPGVSVQWVSVRGVYVLGVSVRGVYVWGGGGGLCPRTAHGHTYIEPYII